MSHDLRDAGPRRRIREAIDRNLLVEAAAGTGKTTSLVDRMVALVASGIPVERICAVTFTIKAAAQLDQKFQNALEKAAREESDPVPRARFEEALSRLDACFIGTIHAFCSRLLRERPVEAGLDPGFEEMDEAQDAIERGESWRRYGERLFTEGSPLLGRLLVAGLELEKLRFAYDVLCENGDVDPVAEAPGKPPDLSGVRQRLEAFLERALPEIPPTVPTSGWNKLQAALRTAGRMRGLLDLDASPQLVSVLRELDRAGRKFETKGWPSKRSAQQLWSDFEAFRSDVLSPSLRRWREYLHPIAMAAIVPAAEEYAAWRRREARVNFQDQLLFARNLLRDHPEARRELQERFTPVLVDEFQDTDPIQAEVLLYLTGSDVTEKDWRRVAPVPGSLFVVGDPKQSIYRFRRADIQTYDTVAQILRKSGGEVLRLSTNFRSTAEICGWANGVFERIFPALGTASQAAHVPLDPFAAPAGGDLEVFRIDVPSASRHSDMLDPDAERIAETIASAIAGEGPFGSGCASPSDFLLLARRRANLPCYARALEARGIPYEIAGGGAFRESEEIASLLTAIEAVADPENPVPLVAALRGRLFGVDDEALYRFRRAGGRFDFRGAPPASADARIRRAFLLLREGADFVDSLPPAAALSRFLERLGSIALAAGGSLGDARAGNLLKALASARELSREGDDFRAIVRRLKELTSAGEVEEMVTRPGRTDVVRLMTLHRAKGLEARFVFLVDPTDPKPREPVVWIDRSTDPPRAHLLVQHWTGPFSSEEIARPLDWEEKKQREQEFLAREDERLMYVAATRARKALVVTFKIKADGEAGGPWKSLDPHISRALPRKAFPATAPSGPAESSPETAAALKEFRAARPARLAAATRPTYASATVTAVAHSAGVARPFASQTGKGMAWGSALHRLLEASMRDPGLDLRLFAANVLAEEDRPPEDLDEALAVVEGVRNSPLWKRALAAKRRLVEVPFAIPVPSADVSGPADGPAETLLSGAIDLLFEEADGWSLVDYKSDTVQGNLEALVRFYAPQISHYRRIWQELTGRPTRAGLFFIGPGRMEWLG